MNCISTLICRFENNIGKQNFLATFLAFGMFFLFNQNSNAQGQLLDVDVSLVSVEWGDDVFCGDGTFTDATGCVTVAGGPDIRFKYRVGYASSNFSSYRYIGASNSPTSGGPTLDNQSNTGSNSNLGSNFDVGLQNVCGSVTFQTEAWEEDVNSVCQSISNWNYDYQSNYIGAGLCSGITDNSDDVHRTGTSNASISANTNLGWTVNLGSGDYKMNWSLLASIVPAPTLSGSAPTICSGGSATLTSSSAESGTVIRWFTNSSNRNGSDIGDGNSITVSPNSTTTYYFAQYKSDCIGASRAVTVTVVPDPAAPSITRNPNSSTVCEGTTLSVNSSGGSGGTGSCANQYRYSTNGGSNYSNWSGTIPSFSAVTGNNRVQSRRNCNGSGCNSNVNTVQWTVQANPGPQTEQQTTCDEGQAGSVTVTETNAAGCSYQVTTVTTWVGQDDEVINETTCVEEEAGEFPEAMINQAGCEYTVTTVIEYVGQDDEVINETTCVEEEAGEFPETMTNQAGCEYTVTTVIEYVGQDDEVINETTCVEEEAGEFPEAMTNQAGCEYTVTTVIEYVGQDDEVINETTCVEEEAGEFPVTMTNQGGCEYTVTTIIEYVGSPDVIVDGITCNEDEAGTTVETFENQFGCEYSVTTSIAYVGQDDEIIEETTCDPNEVGEVSITLENNFGCEYDITTITTLGNDCEDCETPDNLYATNITFFRATLGWDEVPGAIKYKVQGRLKYNIFGVTVSRFVHDNQFRTHHLWPFHAYEFRVKAYCGDGEWSDYSYWEDFYLNPWAQRSSYGPISYDPNKKMEEVDLFDTDKIFVAFQDMNSSLIGVAYFGDELNEGQIRLTDISGQTILSENFELTPNNTKVLQAGDLGSGMYFITLYKDGIVLETEKVMLVK